MKLDFELYSQEKVGLDKRREIFIDILAKSNALIRTIPARIKRVMKLIDHPFFCTKVFQMSLNRNSYNFSYPFNFSNHIHSIPGAFRMRFRIAESLANEEEICFGATIINRKISKLLRETLIAGKISTGLHSGRK